MQFETILLQFLLFCQMLITHFLKRVLFVIIIFFHPIFTMRTICRASRQEVIPITNKPKTASLVLQLVNAHPPKAIKPPSIAIPMYSVNLFIFSILFLFISYTPNVLKRGRSTKVYNVSLGPIYCVLPYTP